MAARGCPSGKRRLRDHREAIAMLHRAQTARGFGSTRRREARAYPCPLCAGWHLTSQSAAPGTGSYPGTGPADPVSRTAGSSDARGACTAGAAAGRDDHRGRPTGERFRSTA